MTIPVADWLTLRELDARAGTPKGEAFRAFRRLEPRWREGLDFLQLRAETAADAIATLRAAQRLYPASPHALLLSPASAEQLLALLAGHAAANTDAPQSQQ